MGSEPGARAMISILIQSALILSHWGSERWRHETAGRKLGVRIETLVLGFSGVKKLQLSGRLVHE
jgi:hypothetical protein